MNKLLTEAAYLIEHVCGREGNEDILALLNGLSALSDTAMCTCVTCWKIRKLEYDARARASK